MIGPLPKGGKDMTAGNKVTISATVDASVKAEADKLFEQLGLNTSAAVNAFLKASVRCGGIPFPLTTRRLPVEYAAVSLEEGDAS